MMTEPLSQQGDRSFDSVTEERNEPHMVFLFPPARDARNSRVDEGIIYP